VQSAECAAGRQALQCIAGLRRSAQQWGNPFVTERHGTRADVIAKYRAWVAAQPGLMAGSTNCADATSSAGARRSRATATCSSASRTDGDQSPFRSNFARRSGMSSSFIAATAMASPIAG
jgi:hypothetical protein